MNFIEALARQVDRSPADVAQAMAAACRESAVQKTNEPAAGVLPPNAIVPTWAANHSRRLPTRLVGQPWLGRTAP